MKLVTIGEEDSGEVVTAECPATSGRLEIALSPRQKRRLAVAAAERGTSMKSIVVEALAAMKGLEDLASE